MIKIAGDPEERELETFSFEGKNLTLHLKNPDTVTTAQVWDVVILDMVLDSRHEGRIGAGSVSGSAKFRTLMEARLWRYKYYFQWPAQGYGTRVSEPTAVEGDYPWQCNFWHAGSCD